MHMGCAETNSSPPVVVLPHNSNNTAFNIYSIFCSFFKLSVVTVPLLNLFLLVTNEILHLRPVEALSLTNTLRNLLLIQIYPAQSYFLSLLRQIYLFFCLPSGSMYEYFVCYWPAWGKVFVAPVSTRNSTMTTTPVELLASGHCENLSLHNYSPTWLERPFSLPMS